MILLQTTSSLLFLILIAKADVLDAEICYTCTCSDGGASIDCSRRGLIDVPNGFSDKVNVYFVLNLLFPIVDIVIRT